MSEALRGELLGLGAAVVGYAGLTGYLDGEIAHLDRAVSIGVARRLNEDTLAILARLQKRTVRQLKARGHRTLAVPPDSDRRRDTFVSKLYALFNHKMAATSAGIGWVGKNGLLISPEHGPRLTLATVLTDAPFTPDFPVQESRCGGCTLCRDHCPSGAITGREWSRQNPFVELVRLDECRGHKASGRQTAGKPNCGLCITVCPYGRAPGTSRPHQDWPSGASIGGLGPPSGAASPLSPPGVGVCTGLAEGWREAGVPCRPDRREDGGGAQRQDPGA